MRSLSSNYSRVSYVYTNSLPRKRQCTLETNRIKIQCLLLDDGKFASPVEGFLTGFQFSPIEVQDLCSIYPEIVRVSPSKLHQCQYFFGSLGFTTGELKKTILKNPKVLLEDLDHALDVFRFLEGSLGLSQEELKEVIVRCPYILSYNLQGHIKPQLAYLESLGEPNLRDLVVCRPEVLSHHIDDVVNFLLLCRLPRRHVHKLLRSYPMDYSVTLRCHNSHLTSRGINDNKEEESDS
ncbi:hypothetical protein CEUSTIGMA_g11409.t1 [Chlamydomonas eustigma]|uniref:Uncharacterized protein n=1 Tax=Chlamydomonas eustigma TaxID=1157962 RepID=A0A250XLN6_9CHLO|nr:hypothetical protein CEUSTIGMA_g11409.t1 [Chlamydomonas eustigma]|eukprot:GAX83984.1 hypothetical protein CEUSTIGMA_g11409.t1 [Chlamydomonas eustigma]